MNFEKNEKTYRNVYSRTPTTLPFHNGATTRGTRPGYLLRNCDLVRMRGDYATVSRGVGRQQNARFRSASACYWHSAHAQFLVHT